MDGLVVEVANLAAAVLTEESLSAQDQFDALNRKIVELTELVEQNKPATVSEAPSEAEAGV